MKIIWSAVTVFFIVALLFVIVPNWHWYKDTDYIESYLLENTPIESSELEVIEYLQSNGMEFKLPWRGNVEAESSYPLNTVGGSSFIRALPGEYRIVFITSVEAFYIFNSDRLLVEIAVRKSVDSL